MCQLEEDLQDFLAYVQLLRLVVNHIFGRLIVSSSFISLVMSECVQTIVFLNV